MADTMLAPPSALPANIAIAHSYDPDAQMHGKMRLSVILMLTLVSGMALAATIVPIGGAVVGSGQVGVESGVKQIAHPIGGTVSDILVRNGQHVRKGQELVRLDDRVTGADAELSTLSADQMLAQKARLEAEQASAAAIIFPTMLTRRSDRSAQMAMADEQRMFALRRSEQSGLAAQLRARIGQAQQQIAGYQVQISALHKQSALLEPERQGVKSLYERKLVTIGRYNQLERQAVDVAGTIGSLQAQIAQARGHISEIREQLIQLAQSRRTESGTQIAAINGQLNQQQLRSISALDAQDRTVIRATQDGTVDRIAVSTIGGVIRPAETIMILVPNGGNVVIEGNISPSDIDQVRKGQSVRIRFSAVSASNTPEIRGRVDYIAADSVFDEKSGRPHVPVRVSIDPSAAEGIPLSGLKPGLPAEIFIETGSRSMLSYITKPLRDQFARSFRDN